MKDNERTIDYHKRSERDMVMARPPENASAEIAAKLSDAASWRKSFEIYPDPGSKEVARGIIRDARSIRTTQEQRDAARRVAGPTVKSDASVRHAQLTQRPTHRLKP